MAEYRARGGQHHHHAASSSNNNKHAQLVNAYQELGRELGSEKLTIVGGYTLGRVIGEGTYGSVHMAIHRLTGMRCAIKKIPKSQTPSLTREIHHHRRLHHPSIVQLYEIIATETHIWLVTELCSGGELFDYLVEKKRFQEGEARRLFGELVVAVGYLHRQGVVHRDLKLENILLDGHLKVKLGDLGFAREFRRGQLMDTFCGTIGYASPEMLAGRKYLGVETDIWSLGIILYTLLCGGMPFDDDDEAVMKSHIMKGDYEEPEWISQESKSLLRDLLRTDPAERPSIDGILAHPWFKMAIRDRQDPHDPAHQQTGQNQLSPNSSAERATPGSAPTPTPSHSIPMMPSLRQNTSPSPLGMVEKANAPGPASDCSDNSQDFTDSEHGQPASDSTAPTTIEEDDLAKSLPRNSSIDFSNTEQMLELLHPNTSQSTIRKPSGDAGGPSAPVKAKVAIKSSLEGQLEEDEDGDTAHPLSHTVHPPLLPGLQHSRTPSRTKRRSVSSSLSLERRASYISNSGDSDLHPTLDYTVRLLEERPAVFSTTMEKQLLDSFKMLGIDTEQMQHSVKSNACDPSAAMWWILRSKRDQEDQDREAVKPALLPSQIAGKANDNGRAVAPFTTPPGPEIELATSRSSTERELDDVRHTKASGSRSPIPSGKTTPPSETPPTGGSSKTPTPSGPSPYRNGTKTRSPSMSMLQRATSAFTGSGRKTDERERDSPEVEEVPPKGDGRGSPTKLQKPPPKTRRPDVESGSVPVVPLNSPIAEVPTGTRFVEEERSGMSPSTRRRMAKRDSIWTAFRTFFAEDKRRRKEPPMQIKTSADSPSATVLLSRGPVARHQAGPLRTPQALPSHRKSIDGRPPLYSRRSSSVNSRRSSVNSSMLPPDHREAINTLARRVSHRSHGSLTPTSEQEIEFPNSLHGMALRHSQYMRSPSMQSDSSGRFHGPAPPSPLHDYHRRPPSGSSSSRVRHFRVIPETTMQRTNSVASSVRSTASSRASSVDKGWAGSGGDDTSMSSKRSRERKRASPKPRTRAARTAASKPPLRDVFEDKDEEWVDEDEFGNERRALAGGVGQGAHTAALKAVDSRAASHPGNWNAGHHHKRRHRHPRSRRGSTDEVSPTSETKRVDEGVPRKEASSVPMYGRRTGPVGRPRQPAVVMEEDEEE